MTNLNSEAKKKLLEIINLHKNFEDLEVLKGIDLTMDSGEVFAFIGASGSGKTTLLRCVNLLEEFHQGTILLDGDSVGYKTINGKRTLLKEKQIAFQRAMTGMVFQSFNLFPHMTAEENIMLGLTKVKRKNAVEARHISDHWMERVGLAERKNHYPAELSGGQQQRVAIARAVALEPKLLLLDEVTSALDPELIGEVLKVIKDLASEGMTMMIVTHEMSFAKQVASKVLFMNEGKIEESGPPDKIFTNPASPRLVNFLSGFSKSD